MKFFDTDWDCIYQWLPVWQRLSPAARGHYLRMEKTHAQPVSEGGYGPDLPLLLGSGMVMSSSPGCCKPAATNVSFRALFVQL